MNLRPFNQRFLQPRSPLFMHEWSVLIMLLGIIGFNVAVHIPAPEPVDRPEASEGPAHG